MIKNYRRIILMSEQNVELKQTLGFWDLMGAAVGQIIGAGIMSLTGVAIGMTGRSVPIAFVLSSILVLINNLPLTLINTVARFKGGYYSIIGSMFSKKYTGAFTVLFIMQNLSLSMYCLSFADYALPFLPTVPRKLLAVGILVIIYGLNMRGIDKFSQFQNVIVGCLVVALATFSVYGMLNMDWSTYYATETFMTDGVMGLLTATAQLTFATGGANVIANLSAEAKNPTRDIPKVMIISTVSVAVIYAFMATIAAGILPVEQVANQPLTLVAETVLPRALYVFFIIGGAWFALISTLNSQLASCTKPLIQAAEDGWLPKKMAYIHPKYRTPVYLLTFFFIVGLTPILLDIDISVISRTVTFVGSAIYYLMAASLLGMVKKLPKEWAESPMHVSDGMVKIIAVATVMTATLQVFLMGRSLPPYMLAINLGVFALAIIFANVRYNSGQVHVEDSYSLK